MAKMFHYTPNQKKMLCQDKWTAYLNEANIKERALYGSVMSPVMAFFSP